jgi:hypothetical protein
LLSPTARERGSEPTVSNLTSCLLPSSLSLSPPLHGQRCPCLPPRSLRSVLCKTQSRIVIVHLRRSRDADASAVPALRAPIYSNRAPGASFRSYAKEKPFNCVVCGKAYVRECVVCSCTGFYSRLTEHRDTLIRHAKSHGTEGLRRASKASADLRESNSVRGLLYGQAKALLAASSTLRLRTRYQQEPKLLKK